MFSEGEQVKHTKKYLVFIFVCFTTWPIAGHALQLKDLYTMSDNDRAWYMGGIYDTNLSSWNDEGITSNCLEGRRQKLSATPDLSGTVLPYVLFRTQR
jgi:hypothetical protein